MGKNNIVRVYVYVPLIAYVVAKILKVRTTKMLDYLAPSMALQQSIGHLVCPFVGCCQSYESNWGIWNPTTNQIVFPNQWLECGISVLIFVILLYYARKYAYDSKGYMYSMFLILFGATRFLLEFLRDNEKLIWGISGLAFHAAFMVVVGAGMYIYLKREEKY